ncbi:unnamed protein product [Anisakis simplex]|uniref:C-type lectin domain-containing protein n=1 Tax=Anisakis simplex TaxID=6269 RepID=A0A0M3JUD4_ANISI|nr:unnamed protein product [Anisakis simplex]
MFYFQVFASLIVYACSVNAQYGMYRSDFYTFGVPEDADAAWRIWQDKLIQLEERLTLRYNHQITLLKERLDELEKQVNDLLKVSTYDWEMADSGSIYKLFTEKKSFDDAQVVCKHFGAQLAVLDSEHKNNFAKDMVNKTVKDDNQEAWIGLKTKASMGDKSTYSNFAGDQPVEGCASMNRKGKWSIKDCDQNKAFICQRITVR